MEKVVFDNFFHFFHEFLRKSLESKKWWKKLSKTTFSTIFVKKNFLTNSWKKWKKLSKPKFPTTQAVLEAQIVEKVGQANFLRVLPILSMLEEEPPHFVLRTRGALLSIIE